MLSVRFEPISKDVQVMLGDLQGQAASELLAAFAAEGIEEAKQINKAALGRVPEYDVFVDGRKGAALQSVKPNGIIVAEFKLISDILIRISRQLEQFSPVKTGRYERSHILFADGVEVDAESQDVLSANEYVFVNKVPYARKIERGSSSQAPDGVYQAVAKLTKAPGLARVAFTYRTIHGGERNPAIVVTPT